MQVQYIIRMIRINNNKRDGFHDINNNKSINFNYIFVEQTRVPSLRYI